ncbi:hypothetical protein CSUI_004044, partial [Cystoisospora suis]
LGKIKVAPQTRTRAWSGTWALWLIHLSESNEVRRDIKFVVNGPHCTLDDVFVSPFCPSVPGPSRLWCS